MNHFLMYLGRAVASVYRLHALRLASWVFRGVSRPTMVARPFFGRSLHLDVSRSNAQQLLWLQGERYMEERFLLESLIKPGMTLVDVGGNIGYYAVMMASYLKGQGAVYCLEPDPTNLIELRANVAGNALENLVTILPLAAGNAEGTIRFEPGLNAYATEDGSMEVEVRRLDSLNLPPIDFIKIDVEGYEGAVLEGAEQMIKRSHPIVFLELHPNLLTSDTHGEIVQFLRSHYTRLSAYRVARGNSWMRALRSYGLMSPMESVRDIQALIKGYETGRDDSTSWIIAQK